MDKSSHTEKLKACLQQAINRFNKEDAKILLNDGDYNLKSANERAIAHRLAVYLELEIARYFPTLKLSVDCEYNRHGNSRKELRLPSSLEEKIIELKKKVYKECSEHWSHLYNGDDIYVNVHPDIIVHARGCDKWNLLVVEIKKESNNEGEEYDHIKLKAFTSRGYGYFLGASISADDISKGERKMSVEKWFQEGQPGEP